MIVSRPYIQTRIFNFSVGIGLPVGCSAFLNYVIADPTYSYKVVYIIFLPLFTAAGLYYLFVHCVWALICDEDKKTLTFMKTFRKKTYAIRHINELIVFKTFFGFDYCFNIARTSITLAEMDNMPDLIAFLKKNNPKLDITSPEDHKYF